MWQQIERQLSRFIKQNFKSSFTGVDANGCRDNHAES